jgi:hypothetical protein
MNFKASLYSVKVDREGESTVVMKVPQSELLEILKLTQMTEVELDVNIKAGE